MKGHAVPWDFIPKEIQFLLGLTLMAIAWWKMHPNIQLIRRWWPVTVGVGTVLMVPLFVAWAGFLPGGIKAASLAAEIQSFFPGSIVSALQSVGSKGLGFKSTGGFFGFGYAFGKASVAALLKLEFIRVQGQQQQDQIQHQQPRQPVEAADGLQPDVGEVQRRPHDE